MKQPPLQLEYAGARTPDTPMMSYVDVLLANRFMIVVVTVLAALIGVAVYMLKAPVYQSDIAVQVEEEVPTAARSMLGDVSSIFDVKQAASGEMEILRSRLVVGHAVDYYQLYVHATPDYFPVVGRWLAKHQESFALPPALLQAIPGGYAWGGERIQVNRIDVPDDLIGKKLRVVALGGGAYELIDPVHDRRFEGRIGQLERFEVPGGAIEVQIDALQGRPETHFTIVRDSRLEAIESLQARMGIFERGRQSGVIGVTLQGQDPVLTAAVLNEIGQEYVRQNTNRKTAQAEKSLAFLDQQLPVLKKQLEESEARYNALRNSRGTIDLGEEAKLVLGQSVEAQNRIFQLKARRQELVTRFAGSHPSIEAIDRQIASITGDLNRLNTKIRGLPDLEQDVVRLTRDVKVNTDLYTGLLNNAQQLRMIRAGKVGNVRVVDTAVAAEKPLSPKAPMVIGVAALAGLVLSVIVAFLRNALFGGLTDPDEIERYTGLPVLATVPFSELQNRLWRRARRKNARIPALLAQSNGSTPPIESLRSFRTVLQVAMRDSSNNIVVFTGPIAGVGKSFLSANFAFIQAAVGKRVLLIDADFRRGTLNRYFATSAENGLFEVLAGTVPLEAVTKRNIMNGVDFISTGKVTFDPSELLASEAFGECLHAMAADYDIVIVDTAPVLSSSDAAVVGAHAAAVMMVVRSGMNTVGEIRETAKRLQQAGAPVAGVVFNGLKLQSEGLGYRSKYGPYRYSRASYYGENQP
ncbi:polysaccharide biosynthesis tyrosine autokinase [Bordetella flabilis]|uniref:Putative tyrosine-protein kinase EpsB n=1 Tax=Bordetella flabilis TaxID=463014 RepID=A0A193GHV2_9BORD|nr:polysaccharide biosynthesis tyrosine autokinase [Bordetella flabilis]ANN78854.1 tyrosine protein kinase [Bordetella flabilis]